MSVFFFFFLPSLLWEGLLLLVHQESLWDTDSCHLGMEVLGGQKLMLSEAARGRSVCPESELGDNRGSH